MLHFFPTPYPGEWWYSVLCRYHARTGYPKFATTIEELFGGKPRSAIGSLFPNNSIYDVASRLPEGLFNVRELILEHTLFLYYLRMAPPGKKEKMLAELCAGKGETVSWIWSSENKAETKLKYCPMCRREDMDAYGETYWRTGHQIPLMTACPRHECRLEEVNIGRRNKLNERFYLPGEYCAETELDYGLKPYEMFLAKTLDAYYRLPMEVGPTEGYSNLAQALFNGGYRTILRRYHMTLNHEMLYDALTKHYGAKLTNRVFGEKSAAVTIARICSWNLIAPERYALLAVLIGQPPSVTFGPRIPDALEERLRALEKDGTVFPKKYIAEQLGVKTHQVDVVCRRYGVEPFWAGQKEKQNDGAGAKREAVKLYCTREEKEKIEAYAKEKNFANTSDFLRSCVRRVMED